MADIVRSYAKTATTTKAPSYEVALMKFVSSEQDVCELNNEFDTSSQHGYSAPPIWS